MSNDIQIERSIAEDILKENKIYVLEETEEFCMYIEGMFRKGQSVFTRIRDKINQKAKETIINTEKGTRAYIYNNSKRNTILEMIKSESFISLKEFDTIPYYICCKNGIYNFEGFDECILPNPNSEDGTYDAKKGDVMILGTKNFITYNEYLRKYKEPYKNFIQIPVNYEPDMKCPNIELFLKDVFGESTVPLIYEMLAYILMPTVKYQKAFLIYGHPSTGKTTFLDMIYKFFNGLEYFSDVRLQDLGERFQVINLLHKLANTFDDLPAHKLSDSFMFRQIVTNRYLRSEKKYVPEYVKWKNRTKLLFTTNILTPYNKKEGDQFFRRWVLLSCYIVFKDESLITEEDKGDPAVKIKDYDMFNKITSKEEFSGLLNNIIDGWMRLYKRGRFSKEWHNIEYVKGLWMLDSNPVKLFVDECCEVGEDEKADYNTFWHTLNGFRESHGVKAITKHMCTQWLQRINGIEKKRKGDGSFYYAGISIKGDIDTSYNRLFIESEKNKKIDDF